ncbi:hypothetical protein SAMD00019534_033870 [Acytostelium subglobosum LB1]|uniref:hypothetical protein n=1 Tax=Acytostelium subglobosum LB1 TaxID=1410327 RepID=UPI000645209E|nr:hypothetical protein SAMD00019534_033870 [Acytostelium subglobosum LB1]GAM20212.1 hypothetical protein SAMD00019534_033870 [Acytostelium subglobosum LB1]|eukprot:XP_012759733.1 hypothetical protein SAMD00019534_033870 [Acytostelium subglobosum LB1]
MDTKPIFVVTQAFSKQGISIINTLLKEGKYQLRALSTRPVDSPPLQKLADKGVQVVQVDLNNKQDLVNAYKGAYGAFLMTPSIQYTDPDYFQKEIDTIIIQADAALEAGVHHVVFSTVDSAVHKNPALKEDFKYDILACRNKAQVYLESLAIPVVSSFLLAFFHSNFIEFVPPVKLEDGSFLFPMPVGENVSLPHVDTYTATGPLVSAFLAEPQRFNRVAVPLYSEFLTGEEIAAIFEKVTGIKSKFVPQTREQYLKHNGFDEVPELSLLGNRLFEIWDSTAKHGYYYKERDLTLASKLLGSSLLTYEQFLRSTGWAGESYAEFREKNNY